MRLVLIGPPGSGKGTQAARLTERFDAPTVSFGEVFSDHKERGTDLGRKAAEQIDAGELVPDEIVVSMARERLDEEDVSHGFLLDGFPRTVPQADALDAALKADDMRIDVVLLVEVPDDLIVERIIGRRSDPDTGRIYHLAFDPPPAELLGKLVHRKDDTEEACRTRLGAYHAQTAPLVPYYEGHGVLRRVDGVGEPADVTSRIYQALGL